MSTGSQSNAGDVTRRALLLDIEGTTTPIVFVHRVLFPYAAASVADFLRTRASGNADAEVSAACQAIRADATPEEAALAPTDAVLAVVRRQMAADVKATGLKQLQGLIWRHGYESGALRGEVYEDVPLSLRRWQEEGRPVAIYSSGSRLAQQLLFRYSVAGDLSPYLCGYYDTTSGAKREPKSYARIAAAWQRDPASILFASDVPAECEAAAAAGMEAVLIMRPGNPPLPPSQPFPVHCDLSRL
jgi:2,3-diketo-5-methylthio-1-phosphopentane phosphatase